MHFDQMADIIQLLLDYIIHYIDLSIILFIEGCTYKSKFLRSKNTGLANFYKNTFLIVYSTLSVDTCHIHTYV